MEEARDWERLFIGEIKAGRDPRRPRAPQKSIDAAPKDVAAFLTRTRTLRQTGRAEKHRTRSCSRIAVLKRHLGDLPLDALEEPDDINRFKTESDYAEERRARDDPSHARNVCGRR